MKVIKTNPRRGCESPHLHQMNTAFQMQAAGLGVKHMLIIPRQYSFDGGELDSIGLRVLKWTAQ